MIERPTETPKPSPIRGRRTSEPVVQTALALVVALGGAMIVGGPLAIIFFLPFIDAYAWQASACYAFLIGAVWMSGATLVASESFMGSFVVSLAGITASFFICFGLPGMPYTSYAMLLPFLTSCAGGGVAWFRLAPRRFRRRVVHLSLSIPACAAIYVLLIAPKLPAFALTRVEGNRAWVNVFADTGAKAVTYVRDPANFGSDVTLREDVRIEMDPGSGDGLYRLQRVLLPDEVNAACTAMRQYVRQQVETEIARRNVPRLLTLLPMRYRCKDGKIWRLTPMPG
jgi:hypothetical protein